MTTTEGLIVTAPGDREIVMTRVFDARRELVFDALTKPELLKRWLFGPDGWELAHCSIDLKPGGAFLYQWRHVNGREMQMSGAFLEILAPRRIVNTEKFDFGCVPQAGEQLVTTELTEQRGRTLLTSTITYPSAEAREAMLKSGFQSGAAVGYDRLADLLTEAY